MSHIKDHMTSKTCITIIHTKGASGPVHMCNASLDQVPLNV